MASAAAKAMRIGHDRSKRRPKRGSRTGMARLKISHPENLGIARLDVLAHPLDRRRVLLHDFDVGKRPASGRVLDLLMKRAHAAEIDHELLAFRTEAEALKEPRRIGVGRRL